MTKQERAIKARAHYEDIKTRLAANTKLSIERTYSFTQHESNLYPILLAFDGTYYAWLNKALYLRNDKQKKADVITCAAPNFRTAHRYQSVSKSENDRVLENRIHFMYQIAEENGVEFLCRIRTRSQPYSQAQHAIIIFQIFILQFPEVKNVLQLEKI